MIRLLLLPPSIVAFFLIMSMGLSGTCTMGDTKLFLSALVISLPFVTIILGFSALTLLAPRYRAPKREMIAYAIVAAVALARLAANIGLLKDVLIFGWSACGEKLGEAAGREDYFIAFGYGALPLILAALAIFAIIRIRTRSKATA